jgi:hypothetical protein
MSLLKTALLCCFCTSFCFSAQAQLGKLKSKVDLSKLGNNTKNEENEKINQTLRSNGRLIDKHVSANACFVHSTAFYEQGIIPYVYYATDKKNYEANIAKNSDKELAKEVFPNSDKFYNELVPACFKAQFLPKWEELKKDQPRQHKESPQYLLESLKQLQTQLAHYTKFSANTAYLQPYTDELTQMQKAAQTYIESGDFQKYKDEQTKQHLANQKMPTAEQKNPAWEKSAMEVISTWNLGTPLKAVITTKDWYVEVNDFRIPTHRHQAAQVAFKTDEGKCFYRGVMIYQDYKGGKYTDTQFSLGRDTPREMACENAK